MSDVRLTFIFGNLLDSCGMSQKAQTRGALVFKPLMPDHILGYESAGSQCGPAERLQGLYFGEDKGAAPLELSY